VVLELLLQRPCFRRSSANPEAYPRSLAIILSSPYFFRANPRLLRPGSWRSTWPRLRRARHGCGSVGDHGGGQRPCQDPCCPGCRSGGMDIKHGTLWPGSVYILCEEVAHEETSRTLNVCIIFSWWPYEALFWTDGKGNCLARLWAWYASARQPGRAGVLWGCGKPGWYLSDFSVHTAGPRWPSYAL